MKKYTLRSYITGVTWCIAALFQTGYATDEELAFDRELLVAAREGKDQAIAALLRRNARLDARDENGDTPLILAVRYRHWDTVLAILEAGHGFGVNILGQNHNTALHWAVRMQNQAIIFTLVENGADLYSRNEKGESALFVAAQRGDWSMVDFLIKFMRKQGETGDPYAPDNKGETPLSVAACHGHTKVVNCLIENAADPNTQDKAGNTALHWAVRNGHAGVVELLINSGKANPSLQNTAGDSPLMLALRSGNTKVVRRLIDIEAQVNTQDKVGNTALHWAAAGGDQDIVDLLIEHGANPALTNKAGQTAAEFARSKRTEASNSDTGIKSTDSLRTSENTLTDTQERDRLQGNKHTSPLPDGEITSKTKDDNAKIGSLHYLAGGVLVLGAVVAALKNNKRKRSSSYAPGDQDYISGQRHALEAGETPFPV